MKFQLKCILIETKPRTGYYVANEGTLVSIVKMDMKNGFCKLSNGNKITIDQAKFCVAKLIGEINNDDKQENAETTFNFQFSGQNKETIPPIINISIPIKNISILLFYF